ncbi:MAG: tripartite tricarboxylate transporter TctB family protein [Bacteroidota bacterium]|nr:tripartite tricarboxylate transporter TctB family protein [Kiloniellaceae bacterium]
MTRDAWIGVVFLAFAVVFWVAADGIRISPLDGPVTAAGLPKSLAYALGALALLLILRSLALPGKTGGGAPAQVPEAEPAEGGERPAFYQHLRAVGMLAFGVGYLLVIPYIGYPLAVAGLILGAALYMGARRDFKTAAVAVLGGLFFYLLFVQFLNVPLPAGLWPGIFAG